MAIGIRDTTEKGKEGKREPDHSLPKQQETPLMTEFAKWDEPANSPITSEQSHEVAANWKDTTQLSNALDAMAFQYEGLQEQLYAADKQVSALHDALYEQIPDGAGRDAVNVEIWKCHDILRAALGVEGTPLPNVDDHPRYDGDK